MSPAVSDPSAPDDPVVAIAAIEHLAYCERQCALIHVDGVWTDNEHTVRGTVVHRRADTEFARRERGRTVIRAVPLFSERWGLTGRADVVELHDDGRVVPVEYKAGGRHGVAAHLQVCAQALCLEEMLDVTVHEAAIWFAGPRRREKVVVDAALRAATAAAIWSVRSLLRSERLPAAPADERCSQCQLIGHCLPQVVSDGPGIRRHMEALWSSS